MTGLIIKGITQPVMDKRSKSYNHHHNFLFYPIGTFCENRINFCVDYNPCANNAQCVDLDWDYR